MLLLTAVFIELGGVLMGTVSETGRELGSSALSVPVFWGFLVLLFITVFLKTLARYELLTRAELLCILFAGLLASPIMTVGFWRFFVPAVATFPRGGDFEILDAVNPNLWPHGPNLTEGILAHPEEIAYQTRGSVRWEPLALSEGRVEQAPIIEHTSDTADSHLRVKLPVGSSRQGAAIPGQPYIVSVLARAKSLGLEANYYCRIYDGGNAELLHEAFSSAAEAEWTYARPQGFRRVGIYGVVLPKTVKDSVILELGLKGDGEVVFRDLKFINVEALESAFRGRTVIHQEDFAELPEEERTGLLVEPDRLFSFAGVRYLLTAYIPWKDWIGPISTWGIFLVLILAATFSFAVIMRKEWIDNQRLPLPFAQIPMFFLGSEGRESSLERFLPEGWQKSIYVGRFRCNLCLVPPSWLPRHKLRYTQSRHQPPGQRLYRESLFLENAGGNQRRGPGALPGYGNVSRYQRPSESAHRLLPFPGPISRGRDLRADPHRRGIPIRLNSDCPATSSTPFLSFSFPGDISFAFFEPLSAAQIVGKRSSPAEERFFFS